MSPLPFRANTQDRQPLLPAIVLGVVGYHVFIVQPGFVAGLVTYGGLTESQAGYLAATEMSGIAASTIIMTWLMTEVSWRRLSVMALLLVVAGNLFSTRLGTVGLLSAARLIVGVGSGALLALSYAWVGLSRRPERNFGILLTAVLSYGAIGLLCLPTAFARLGTGGVFTILAILSACGLFLVPLIDKQRLPAGTPPVPRSSAPLSGSRWLALGAVLAYFVGQGVVWPYLALVGIERGLDDQSVARGLTIAQFLGIAGAFSASYVTRYVRHAYALSLAIIFGTLPLISLQTSETAFQYDVSASLFNFFSNLVTPLIMAIMARLDSSARLVGQAVAVSMVGLAAGPALAASLVGSSGHALAISTSIGLFAISMIAILPVLFLHPIETNSDSPNPIVSGRDL